MGIAELQSYGYLALTVFLTVILYAYIYHLYTTKKDSDGHDYEDYGDLALKDDLSDTLVSPRSKEK